MQELSVNRSRERRLVMNRGPNLSIYRSSNYGTEPRCIYFYYLTPRTGGYDVSAYFFDNGAPAIPYRDVKQRAVELVDSHRKTGGLAHRLTRGFDEEWRRRSWLLLVLGAPGYEFHPGNAIIFRPGGRKASNQAFLDGHDFAVAAGNGDRLSAVCCINHMYANEQGDDLLEDEIQEFSLVPNYRPRAGFQRPRPPDTGGTNMGPLVPPPA